MKCVVYVTVLVLSLCFGVFGQDDHRSKRTLGFIFRGLVDAATREGQKRFQASSSTTTSTTTTPVSITVPPPTPDPVIPQQRVRPAPKPMIYIIPVSHKSPHAPDVNSLTEVLKDVKVPVKIKVEGNGSTDPDLKALLQATKLLTVDKRNASYKESLEETFTESNQVERVKTEPKERHVTIKIQSPVEGNDHQFTVRVIGDDVKVRKTKNGYVISLADAKADIKLEFPKDKSEKQSQPQAPQRPTADQVYQPYPSYFHHQQFADAFRPADPYQSRVNPYQPIAGLQQPQQFAQHYPSFQIPNYQQPSYDQPSFGSEKVECSQFPGSLIGFSNCSQNANSNLLGI